MGDSPRDDLKSAGSIEREVNELRLRTQALADELERRIRFRIEGAKGTMARLRHAADVRARMREHPLGTITVGMGGAIAIGFGVFFLWQRRELAARPMARLRRRAAAYRALLAHPEAALRSRERLGSRLLAAVVITASTVIVRRLAERLSAPLASQREPRRLPAHT